MTAKNLILVVDDDANACAANVRLLEGVGFAVRSAGTGQEGLDSLRQQRPDLVLLDVDLPDMGGLEVCRQIKQDPEHATIFVVMLSASQITSELQSAGLEAGADGYIARPIANRELLARVQAFMRIQRTEAALRLSETRLRAALEEKEELIAELQAAVSQVKTLSGLLPICAGCKKIRDDQGYWDHVEHYVAEHSGARFTHGLCPDCMQKIYPELFN